MEKDEREFFVAMPAAFPIYERLTDSISAVVPQMRVDVWKSQISFIDKRIFAAAWLPPRTIKGRPDHYLIAALWLGHPLQSPG